MSRRAQPLPKSANTLAEDVRQQLATEIAAGILAPGTRLDETEQSLRLNVSRTPLREALRQLAATGLVRGLPHRGVTVVEGINTHLADALVELETLCGCRAGARMNGRERVDLRRVAAERGAWLDIIHVSAANPVLVRFAETLWQPLMGRSGGGRLTNDDIHPFGQRLAEAVAAGEDRAIEAAARSLVDACVAAWFRP